VRRGNEGVGGVLEEPVGQATADQEHDGVGAEVFGGDELAGSGLHDDGEDIGRSHEEEEAVVLVEWQGVRVGDLFTHDGVLVDVGVDVGLGLQLSQCLDLIGFLDQEGAVADKLTKDLDHLVLNGVECFDDGIVVVLDAPRGFFVVRLDVGEPLDTIVELHSQRSLETVWVVGPQLLNGPGVFFSKSIDSDGPNIVQGTLDVDSVAYMSVVEGRAVAVATASRRSREVIFTSKVQ